MGHPMTPQQAVSFLRSASAVAADDEMRVGLVDAAMCIETMMRADAAARDTRVTDPLSLLKRVVVLLEIVGVNTRRGQP